MGGGYIELTAGYHCSVGMAVPALLNFEGTQRGAIYERLRKLWAGREFINSSPGRFSFSKTHSVRCVYSQCLALDIQRWFGDGEYWIRSWKLKRVTEVEKGGRHLQLEGGLVCPLAPQQFGHQRNHQSLQKEGKAGLRACVTPDILVPCPFSIPILLGYALSLSPAS